jgi:hypothetical protein
MTVSVLDYTHFTDQLVHRSRKLGSQHTSAALTTHLQSSLTLR